MKAYLIHYYTIFLAHFLNAGTEYILTIRARIQQSQNHALVAWIPHMYTPSPKKQQGMVSNNKMLIQVLLQTA